MAPHRVTRFVCSFAAGVCALTSVAAAQVGLDAVIQEKLNLDLYSVQRLEVPEELGAYVEIDLVLDGQATTIRAFRHSTRAQDFTVYAFNGAGERVEVPAPPLHTYRGLLQGFRGAKVAASLHGGQLHAWIALPHEIWIVQPVTDADPNADADLHVIYRMSDVVPGPWTCGVDNLLARMNAHIGGSSPAGGQTMFAEVAWDADFEYFTLNGSSVPNTVADIEAILNATDMIYQTEVNLGYTLTAIVVRNNPNDPYTSSDPNTLLIQFQQEWVNNQGGIARDVAHFMTGKDLNGSVIGIAFFDGVCIPLSTGFGLSESKFSGNFGLRTALTCHELGHNWSAGHCDGDPDCAIMCSGIGGCPGGIDNFGVASTAAITNWANSVNCLDEGQIGGTATWQATVVTNDGDDIVELGETATVTLSLNFEPDVDDVNVLGLAATIFDVVGDSGATMGQLTGWQVLNNLADLTGDLTMTDGVSLFGVNAGQLTAFGPFSNDDPLDVLSFTWMTQENSNFQVGYDTVTDAMVVWEGPLGQEVGVDWVPVEVSIDFQVVESMVCYADCNGDGVLNVLDFICFQNAFSAGCP